MWRAGATLVAILRLLIAVASLAAEHGLSGTQASVAAARGLYRAQAQQLWRTDLVASWRVEPSQASSQCRKHRFDPSEYLTTEPPEQPPHWLFLFDKRENCSSNLSKCNIWRF